MSGRSLDELINEVLWRARVWDLPPRNRHELLVLAAKLRIPRRAEVVRNFVAAYLVVAGFMDRRTADRVVASSPRGRRLWERRIRELLGEAVG